MSANMQIDQAVAVDPSERATGLLTGSQVLTMNGYQAIETLNPGARIITRNGLRILKAVEATETMMRPVRIAQGSLGCSRPKQEMMTAPHQELLVRDWRANVLFGAKQAIVPVARMIDDRHIKPLDTIAMHWSYDLHFETEEVFYADGMEFVAQPMAVMPCPFELAMTLAN